MILAQQGEELFGLVTQRVEQTVAGRVVPLCVSMNLACANPVCYPCCRT